ncbi:MoaD/ThiS family protein [Blautia sp.]|uniref:MoaD/ThiS family protein n=1 Tax=Blautia sp. TaxID=1955243 RepID=UPI0025903184|nr:MoaD/ThiS family protein [Blautia sp.]
MTITIIMESIIIPRTTGDCRLELEQGAAASDAVEKLEEKGLTGELTAREVLDTHMLICNSKHIKPDDELKDGDRLIIMKTLLGG